MSESIPAIRVTDPQSRDMVPQSPPGTSAQYKTNGFENGGWTALSREGRPNTPGKLLRSLSNTVSNQQNSQTSQSIPVTGDNATSVATAPDSPIDPLSQHILRRTHTPQNSLPTLLRPTSSGASATSDEKVAEDKTDGNSIYTRQSSGRPDTGQSTTSKEKRKGVSFLSRIIGGTKKKETDENVSDDVSDAFSDLRPEGMEAQVFSQPVNNIGYEPRHAQPPAYIRVRARYKKERDFDRVFLAQELKTPRRQDRNDDAKSIRSVRTRAGAAGYNPNTIWALQFSRDGRYLAAAGHDKVIRIWAVISSPEERRQDAMEDDESEYDRQVRLSAPVFKTKPIREFEGHMATVLDLTWSKNNFLLSSSMDKTVRLWHVSREECLCTFKHNDFVTSIAFHPKDDRFFLAGSLDSKLRLWSIPDKTVAYWSNLGDMVTAVEFTPDGKYAIGGCLNGLCMFYETEGLKYQTQIHVRSAHGKNAKGSKITNIQAISYPPNSGNGDTKLLITSNDSRIRLYNFRDKALEIKFKGNVNDSSQIRATFSDDAKYVICGSEDNKAYIWTMSVEDGEKRHKRPMEFFTASDTITTCVTFAPSKTRQLLGRSDDPMYDICNPPPVTLMSMAERAESRNSSRPATEDGVSPPESEAKYRRPEESQAYLARSTHKNGHIIVTADYNGCIKVFRQDCAWAKRRNDYWETSSVFSKATGLRRTASIATRGSSRSLRSAHGSVKTQAPSERILSWRQNITSAPSVIGTASLRSGKAGGSISPRKSSSQLSLGSNKAQGRPESKSSMGPPPRPKTASSPGSPASKAGEISATPGESTLTGKRVSKTSHGQDPLHMQGDHSNLFWKLASHAKPRPHDDDEYQQQESRNNSTSGLGLPHPLQRNESKVSTLSIDLGSNSESSDDEFMDALDLQQQHGNHQAHPHESHHHHRHHHDKDSPTSRSEMVCRHCGSNSFSVARAHDGETRFCCTACGTVA